MDAHGVTLLGSRSRGGLECEQAAQLSAARSDGSTAELADRKPAGTDEVIGLARVDPEIPGDAVGAVNTPKQIGRQVVGLFVIRVGHSNLRVAMFIYRAVPVP